MPQESANLLSLLSHYARLGSEDRTVWQDRLMHVDGVEREQLTALHGELIACDWIEQNTGRAHLRPDGTIAACYRITRNGLREYRRIQGIEGVEEHLESAEKPEPRVPRKKKDESQNRSQPDAVASSEEGQTEVCDSVTSPR